jgi:DNA-binding LacI/PurR family transcriptional regulator
MDGAIGVRNEDVVTVTIRDVAAAAGVSLTTVSHVLSNQGRIGERTRQRVWEVARELGYRANVHAQQLVTNRSSSIAIQIAPFNSTSKSSMLIPNSEYFLEVLNGASEEADDRGYALVLTPPGASPIALSAFGFDGAIIVDPHGDEGLLDPQWTESHPVVTAGRTATESETHYVVDNDHKAAAELVLDHLWQQGYRQPAAMITDRARSYTRDLAEGYERWARRHGVTTQTVETGAEVSTAQALRALLDGPCAPDAIYAGSEDIALDLLHETNRLGIKIPGDLGVCSCVDSSTFSLTTPEVSGLFLYPREIGKNAVSLLIDLIEGKQPAHRTVMVPARLCQRRSTLRLA